MTLERGKVRIVQYDPAWRVDFEEEKKRLEDALGNAVLEIRHDGSTAIPDMPAKPIIDVLAAVRSLNDVEAFKDKLVELGYTDREKGGVSGRRFFVKGPEEARSHHLSFAEPDSEHWISHVLFNEYLLSHPGVRKEYIELKKKLASQYAEDRGSYTEGKVAFIRAVIDRAKNEKR